MLTGFLLTRAHRDTPNGVLLELWASTERGPALLRIADQKPVFFVERGVASGPTATRKPVELLSLGGAPMDALYFDSQRELLRERDRVRERGGQAFEADIRPADRFLMERFITGACEISGGEVIERSGYLEIRGPSLRAAEYLPKLRSVSLDLETYGLDGPIFSAALAFGAESRVLMVDDPGAEQIDKTAPSGVQLFATEALLLAALVDELRALDPDLILGWNVVDFDFTKLVERCAHHRLPLAIGRDGSNAEVTKGNQPRVRVAGRVVLDGISVLIASSQQLESYALDDVAQLMLGRGKAIDHHKTDPMAEILRMYRNDRAALAHYNLEDCRLVQEVFAHADLIGFLLERQQLTGLALDRMRGAVAAFDYSYLPRLHRAGYVAPSIGDDADGGASPGGYVMDSAPGLYEDVIVLDFKSLYPSIIRTFCIDPLGLAVAGEDAIPGFEGAAFDRKRHILPDLITTLWRARDEAKLRKDAARSQAIKILMNSFYGVLGTPGCRFFNPQLASSITRRGHEIITRSRKWIEAAGLPVIYGDTDSLFVLLGERRDAIAMTTPKLDAAQCQARGAELAAALNAFWKDELRSKYQLESQLELQFDTHYVRFFMPTLRNSEHGSKKRYAGRVRDRNQQERLVFKGLEAVRTDWTPLARRFQRELYRRIFRDEDYADFIRAIADQLYAGELDAELVYRKRLRRPTEEYVKNVPPHVRAARMLDQQARHISYVMTLNGPEPVQAQSVALDYQHYLERQLAPAADAILQHLGTDFMRIAGRQLSLF